MVNLSDNVNIPKVDFVSQLLVQLRGARYKYIQSKADTEWLQELAMSYKAQKSSVSAAVKQLQSSPHHQLSLSKTFSLSLSIFPYPFHSQLQFHLPPSTHSFPQMQTPPY
uniref:Uncharacterized protein n=1 Tax=Cucumis melo TaxID=3656 RepID=A0A9I9EMA5_CUCME